MCKRVLRLVVLTTIRETRSFVRERESVREKWCAVHVCGVWSVCAVHDDDHSSSLRRPSTERRQSREKRSPRSAAMLQAAVQST